MKIVTAALAAPLLFTAAAATPARAVDAGNPGTVVAPQTVPDILSGKEKQFYTQILAAIRGQRWAEAKALLADAKGGPLDDRSAEHTSELQPLMRNSYAVFC